MINILVISDNVELVSHMQTLHKKLKGIDFKIDYRFSVVNKNPDGLLSLGMTCVDVKDTEAVASIVNNYDLVISAHCKQIFPKELVENVRCINIHPGLNPYNRGWYPQVFSIINKMPIGCTIHEMNEHVDHGAIIYQRRVDVYSDDTSLEVYNRVQNAEKELLNEYFKSLVLGSYKATKMKGDGNYNGIEDFNKLCELDLNHYGTLSEHLDILRALSHGEFSNAYFTNCSGDKVYLKLDFIHRRMK
ncbi:dTDP-4-amino-4,6-dideoxyglucose formyltransferase [Denitrificimonas caeni]|uniref:phosphoribosylglycinamide formyltransferase 1 n=1 Tax=Denitrificimonas caeni TaxID=521720 RepID=A0AAE9VUG0_9GAMM|nr:dTDP-4-amino-4,6-dideoxyglucose formyltransferase [Denitrificimonas caeni]WBE25081.1 dTDP-4-amino-4,6-dideoxyglucose formyltransferase [Denitrificimonas caeni]